MLYFFYFFLNFILSISFAEQPAEPNGGMYEQSGVTPIKTDLWDHSQHLPCKVDAVMERAAKETNFGIYLELNWGLFICI